MRVLACLVLFASVSACSRNESSPAPAPALPAGPPQLKVGADGVVDVGEFQFVYNEFVSNPAAGRARYGGRVLEGLLTVDALDTGKAKILLTQHTALTGDTAQTLRRDPTKGVTAEIDDPGPGPAAKAGDRLKLRGEIRDFEAGILTLHHCRLVEKVPPADPNKDGQSAGTFVGEGTGTKSDGPPAEKAGQAPEKKDR
jgi:hypothetical protein